MNQNLDNIAIVTTVSNKFLFKKTVEFFPENIEIIVIDGSDGLFGLDSIKFMFKKLKRKKFKWVIMADEDVVFVNVESIFSIIKEMQQNNYGVAGIRDGGVLPWRDKNPYLINPFFCVLNFEKINSFYNEQEFLNQNYLIEGEFNDNLEHLSFKYSTSSLFENYYCFFIWLRRKNINIKFLNAQISDFENDSETTTVFGLNNEIVLYHTWYARTYGLNMTHTNRINNVIEEGFFVKKFDKRKITYLKSYSFTFKKNAKKIYNKIKNHFK